VRTSIGQMDGDQWENYCQTLLRLRYEDYQEVPAQFGGDLGIEGFTRSGLVFQCYCPDEDPSGEDLYVYQRDKITKDISKLIKNAAGVAALGAGTIKEWHFLTPRYNSRHLVEHCRVKETEVQAQNLANIHREFIIMLKTEDDYITERHIFREASGHKIHPPTLEPSTGVDEMLKSDNQIVQNIRTKLGKLSLRPEDHAKLTRHLVTGYVIGQSDLQFLNQRFPVTYHAVVGLKDAVEFQLALRVVFSTQIGGALLQEVLAHYENKLSQDLNRSLAPSLIVRLGTEALSDWLGRCPLDFPGLEGQS